MTRASILIQALSGRGQDLPIRRGREAPIWPRAQVPPDREGHQPRGQRRAPGHAHGLQQGHRPWSRKPELVEKGYTRIVLDSYRELTELMPEWLQMGFLLQIQDYGTIGNKAMELVRALLKAPSRSSSSAAAKPRSRARSTGSCPGVSASPPPAPPSASSPPRRGSMTTSAGCWTRTPTSTPAGGPALGAQHLHRLHGRVPWPWGGWPQRHP